MFTLVNGLPAHVLLVHVVVVLVPIAALLLLVAAVWPAARRRLGLAVPIVAVVSLLSVPPAKDAGEWLAQHVPDSPLVRDHVQYADAVLPWTLGLTVVACGLWALGVATDRRRRRVEAHETGAVAPESGLVDRGHALVARAVPAWATGAAGLVVAGVLAVAVSAGSVAAVYHAGDSGARAAWHDQVSSQPQPGAGDGD
jgi:hypothetical protein